MAHVALGRDVVEFFTDRSAREDVLEPADRVTERMAAERIEAQERHVQRENDRSDPDPELLLSGGVLEPHPLVRVVREDEEVADRRVHEVAMQVLQDEREGPLAGVRLVRLADGARGRREPVGFVVSAAVVVTGESKTGGRDEDQERRRVREWSSKEA